MKKENAKVAMSEFEDLFNAFEELLSDDRLPQAYRNKVRALFKTIIYSSEIDSNDADHLIELFYLYTKSTRLFHDLFELMRKNSWEVIKEKGSSMTLYDGIYLVVATALAAKKVKVPRRIKIGVGPFKVAIEDLEKIVRKIEIKHQRH